MTVLEPIKKETGIDPLPRLVSDVARRKEHSVILPGSVLNCRGFGRGFVKRSNIHGVTFPLDPEICSLGNFTNYHLETNYAKKLTEILLTIPKKCIAIKWKSDAPLPIKMLLCEINSCVPLEKITYWMQKRWKSMEKLPLLGCVLWTDKTLLKISFYTRCKSWCKPVSQHYLTHSPFAHP